MQPWIAATLAGLLLGLVFYGCVRMRMYLGPILRAQFGNRARQAYWIATFILMIGLANLALYGLRAYFASLQESANYLLPEIWFVAIAVALAMTLIFRRMTRKKG
jgi:hypothetical protein